MHGLPKWEIIASASKISCHLLPNRIIKSGQLIAVIGRPITGKDSEITHLLPALSQIDVVSQSNGNLYPIHDHMNDNPRVDVILYLIKMVKRVVQVLLAKMTRDTTSDKGAGQF